jgi:hypothetical protein
MISYRHLPSGRMESGPDQCTYENTAAKPIAVWWFSGHKDGNERCGVPNKTSKASQPLKSYHGWYRHSFISLCKTTQDSKYFSSYVR